MQRYITVFRDPTNALDWGFHVSESMQEVREVVNNLNNRGVKRFTTYPIGESVNDLSSAQQRVNEMKDEWVAHTPGPMPVSGHCLVLTKRVGEGHGHTDRMPETAYWWDGDGTLENSNWQALPEDGGITAYKVVG